MNAKTAKKLRRFAVKSGRPEKALKKLWNTTPDQIKPEFRTAVKQELA